MVALVARRGRVWSAACLLLAGCQLVAGLGERSARGEGCDQTNPCANGLSCFVGTCAQVCVRDQDCATGRCLTAPGRGLCFDEGELACSADTPCPLNTLCSAGVCRTSCSSHSNCASDQQCTADRTCVGTDRTHDPAAVAAGGSGADVMVGEGGGGSGKAGADSSGAAMGGTPAAVDGGAGAGGEPSKPGNAIGCPQPRAEPPSCAALSATSSCQGESCCTSLLVPGTSAEGALLNGVVTTVADFSLDKYEVTVGRFAAFVAAFNGPPGPPSPECGEHPRHSGSGWQAAWNGALLAATTDWTSHLEVNGDWSAFVWKGSKPTLPMNSVTWYEAQAFCLWDGGRLPSEVEWEYAATGGFEWTTPWGPAPVDTNHAVYGCLGDGKSGCATLGADIVPVGSRPAGAGRWGHLDLAGSMAEWVADAHGTPYPAGDPCADCVRTMGPERVTRGGAWRSEAIVERGGYEPDGYDYELGFRCAREP